MTSLHIHASESTLNSVTIFRSSNAEIVRSFSLALKTGQNTVHITQLSSDIDTDSARISGLDNSAARLLDVVCSVKSDGFSSDSAKGRSLSDKKIALENERSVRLQEVEVLTHYSLKLSSEHVQPGAAAEFFDDFVQRKIASHKTIQELDGQIARVQQEILEESNKRKGKADAQVTVVISALQDCTAELVLAYLVKNANWEPCYDLHATTVDGALPSSLSLQYCAQITQATGEDWTDASLLLSTAASQALHIPAVMPRKIRVSVGSFSGVIDPPPQRGQSVTLFGGSRMGSNKPMVGGLFGNVGAVLKGAIEASQSTAPPLAPQAFSQSRVPEGGSPSVGFGSNAAHSPLPSADIHPSSDDMSTFTIPDESDDGPDDGPAGTHSALHVPTAAYAVQGALSIPSDGMSHRVCVTMRTCPATLTHVCVPHARKAGLVYGTDARKTLLVEDEDAHKTVFIECAVRNSTGAQLLAGSVRVFLDGGYVSKTTISNIAVNESFTCTLGADPALCIARTRTRRARGDTLHPFPEPTNRTTFTVRTVVANRGTRAVPALVVREVVPLSEDGRISVVLKQPNGLAEAKDGEDVVVEDEESTRGGRETQKRARWGKVVDGRGGEKAGVFEWISAVDPGESVTFVAEWEARAPVSVAWEEVVA
ncbi:hypothetical protein B0H21DRAFT_890433 [Amylocystis lapponica]|nr:hypothetical protein B0H21DRAFT_890433 [Amylocystis lapponica]